MTHAEALAVVEQWKKNLRAIWARQPRDLYALGFELRRCMDSSEVMLAFADPPLAPIELALKEVPEIGETVIRGAVELARGATAEDAKRWGPEKVQLAVVLLGNIVIRRDQEDGLGPVIVEVPDPGGNAQVSTFEDCTVDDLRRVAEGAHLSLQFPEQPGAKTTSRRRMAIGAAGAVLAIAAFAWWSGRQPAKVPLIESARPVPSPPSAPAPPAIPPAPVPAPPEVKPEPQRRLQPTRGQLSSTAHGEGEPKVTHKLAEAEEPAPAAPAPGNVVTTQPTPSVASPSEPLDPACKAKSPEEALAYLRKYHPEVFKPPGKIHKTPEEVYLDIKCHRATVKPVVYPPETKIHYEYADGGIAPPPPGVP